MSLSNDIFGYESQATRQKGKNPSFPKENLQMAKSMKKLCVTIRKMQIKTSMRYYPSVAMIVLRKTHAGKDV